MSYTGVLKSRALILSYILDWVIIIAAAGVGAALGNLNPNKRPFSIADLDISFPYTKHKKISTTLLMICVLVIPAGTIFLVTLLVVPGPTISNTVPRSLKGRRKLWEWHTGWLGLALALSIAWLITSGMKNLFGKSRPDLIARCHPDLTSISSFAVGGFNNTEEGVLLVSAAICQSVDTSNLNDGFRSFPSGHASFSAAGLVYLSFFLAAKFAIAIPFLAVKLDIYPTSDLHTVPSPNERPGLAGEHRSTASVPVASSSKSDAESHHVLSAHNLTARNQAASPPIYLLLITAIPSFATIYISSTRYSDFRHH